MATPKKIQYKDYADYLKSPKWKQVKQDYRDNESTDYCLVCGDYFTYIKAVPNYHHFIYPTDWNNDTWENLLLVCECCHSRLHELNTPDSKPISLRSYLRYIAVALKSITKQQQIESHNESMWCATKGEFSITSKGVKRSKTMALSMVTQNPSMIAYFEKCTDECIKREGS